jgi:hypothetical protein
MKTIQLAALSLACALTAHADFSYTQTSKTTGGMMGGMAGAAANRTSKHFMKGQKSKTDSGTTSVIMDFEAQTVTTINNDQKTYTVMNFSDMGKMMKDAGADVQIDVKDTGQRKVINGFNAKQVILNMTMENMAGPGGKQAAPAGMKMNMEMELWISSDVPGAQEAKAFYQKNAEHLPFASMAGGGNASMQKAMADMQKKMATMGGVPVMQVVRMKMGGPGGDAQMAQAQAGMADAMARLEAMKKQGGKQAEMAEQMAARMGGMRGGSGGSLMEITMESTGFSTASIPDSTFAIPAGYQKK